MKKNKHMGKCEEYLAEVHKCVGNNGNGQGFVLPVVRIERIYEFYCSLTGRNRR